MVGPAAATFCRIMLAAEGGDGSGVVLEVPGEAAASADPCEGSFDHPSLGQDDKSLGDVGSFDDLDLPGAGSGGSGANARSLIAAIGVDAFDEGEQASRPFVEHQRGAVAILDGGGVNRNAQQQTQRVDEDVALATRDLLARIEALRIDVFAPF